jgi:hypothetical protein
VSIEFKPVEKIDKKFWDQEVLKRIKNLNLLSYFIEYQCVTWNLQNIGGIVYDNDRVLAIYVVIVNKKTKTLISPISGPLTLEKIDSPKLVQANKLFLNQLSTRINIGVLRDEIILNDNWDSFNLNLADKKLHPKEKIVGFNMIIDLKVSTEELWANLDRNHKRTIKRSRGQGIQVTAVDKDSNPKEIDLYFKAYKSCHKEAAGRQTRIDESFDYMLHLVSKGVSTLFVAHFENLPISFLYCDRFDTLSRGWSQATAAVTPDKVFPRTLLEWSAIEYFKKQKCSVYHLGSYFSDKQENYFPNEGFMEFKRRFGSLHIPFHHLNFRESSFND